MPKIFIGFGKHQTLDLARAILYGKERHTLVVLGGLDGHRRDHTRDAHACAVGEQRACLVRKLGNIHGAKIGNAFIVAVQQMPREIHTRRVLFQHQLFPFGIIGNLRIREGGLCLDLGDHAEHIQLACDIVAVLLRHGIDDLLVDREQPGAIDPERIKRARLDQGLDHALVHILARHALHKVLKGCKIMPFSLTAKRIHKLTAHVFECQKAKADGVVLSVKIGAAAVDIGRQHRDAALVAFSDIFRNFCLISKHAGQQCREIFTGIMRLEIRGSVGQHRIRGGVRFIECVVGEIAKVVKQLGGGCLVHTALRCARDKVLALGLQHVRLFLGHGAAHDVRVPKAVPCHLAENAHDLLLVHGTAVRFLQNGLQERRVVFNLCGIVAALDIARDRIHGAGTIKCNDRDDILKALGAQLHKHLLDAA